MEVPEYTPEVRDQMAGPYLYNKDTYQSMPTQEFRSTYDDAYRQSNPYEASRSEFRTFRDPVSSKADAIAGFVNPYIQKGIKGTDNFLSGGYAGPTLAGAGIGLAAGYFLNRYLRKRGEQKYMEEGSYGLPGTVADMLGDGKAGLLAAGVLGGGAALLHKNRQDGLQKTASMFGTTDPVSELIRIINNATQMSPSEKATIMAGIQKLNGSQATQLRSMLFGASGVAAGAIITKFLGAKGLLPMVAGAILGGMIGAGMPSTKRNIYGQFQTTPSFY